MKIGLIDIDSKIPNLALMKLSAFHKKLGNSVEWYSPLFNYDKIYASKIFTESKYDYLPYYCDIGGSGHDLRKDLPNEIEHIYPDYSLYNIDYAMGFLTRGCFNKCDFCVIPKKEGTLRRHAYLDEFWDGQERLILLDNDLTDYYDAKKELQQIIDKNIQLDLTQGFNVRTIKPEIAELLSKIKLWRGKQWHIAWDNYKEEKSVLNGINILNDQGIKNYRLMCYVLIGFNSGPIQDLHRIYTLEKLGIDPFAMCYIKDNYSKHLARWCNRKQIFKSCSFIEYLSKKKNVKLLDYQKRDINTYYEIHGKS